ncbi:MAG: cytochrome P450 [Pseudomonadota bacterium]
MTESDARTADRSGPHRVEKRSAGQSDHDYVESLRARGPVAIDRHGFYWTFSHAHLLACVAPETTRQVETEKVRAMGLTSGAIHDYFANSLLFSNGAVHQRRRRPLAKTFAFSLMDGMRPRIRAVAEAMIRPHLGREVDFLAEIAGPLPARIVAEIIGAPEGDIPRFSAMVYGAMRALSLRTAEDLTAGAKALADLDAYVAALLDVRRRTPKGDFLSDYVAGAAAGDLTEEEARTQISSVILAGADTTRMALCSTVSQLLQHPEQWAAFAADPDGMKAAAAAEGLRFDPVIGSLPRVATRDLEIGGASVPAGAVLAPVVLAALRDPEVYAAPGRFDIHRDDHPRHHPVFGAGAHRCLGEALARAELEEALATLIRLAPGAALVGPPPRLRGVSGARAIDQMRLRLG